MSAAPVSRSSALPEIPLPSRRTGERSEPEQAFALPPEPVERPRLRRDDDRSVGDSALSHEASKPDDARRTTAAETRSPARVDEAGRDRKAAGAGESSDKAKTEPAAGEAADVAVAGGKKTETAGGDKPAEGRTVEERKAALAAALDGAPVIGKGTPEEQAAAGAVMQPAPVPAPGVTAEFLALAALTLQGGEPAKPDGAATPEGKPEGQVVATGAAGQAAASAAVVPVPTIPVKADGQASAGGEAAAADIKAGLTPQLPATGTKTDAKPGEAKPGETQQGDAKAADSQATPKDAGETGKAIPAMTGGEVKATETAAAGQSAQAGSSDAAAPAADTQPASAPLSPQAILAAGPQSLTAPQAPLTELDAAAQATAQAQAEAVHKMVSGETGRATPLHVVPVEIGAQALAGNKRFDIRLDPAELGRIDVRLEISDKGEVSAKLTVDRVETLHMLQRDARTLERAFEQAGLKPSEGGIDLSLRDPGDQQAGARQQRQDDEAPRGRRTWVQASEDSALVTEVASLPRHAGRLGGVDLSI